MLEEITTPRQQKNGTRAFYCTTHNVTYTSHNTGYVRRRLKSYGQLLNHRIGGYVKTYPWGGRSVLGKKVVLILEEEERIKLIKKAAANYKGYTGEIYRLPLKKRP